MGHPFSMLVRDTMAKFSLVSSFDLMPNFDPNVCYTRSEPRTNSFTLIDGILLSDSLTSAITGVRISDSGNNVSDHRPVEVYLEVKLTEISLLKQRAKPTVN